MDIPINLVDDHFDGELSTDGFIRLDDWLQEDDTHLREFAVSWLIHSGLHDAMSQRAVQADALFRAMTSDTDFAAATAAKRVSGSQPSSESISAVIDDVVFGEPIKARAGSWRLALIGLAALLLIGTSIGMWAYVAALPRDVAVLTQTSDAQWEPVGGRLFDGALLKKGDVLRLNKGRAQVTFFSGARTVIEAPAIIVVDSEMAASLSKGAATTTVPTQAVGFTMNVPQGKVVDLGTAFTLRIRTDDTFEVQVFEGLVELHLIDEKSPVDDAPLRIAKGMAVSVSAGTRAAQSIPYDARQKMSMP